MNRREAAQLLTDLFETWYPSLLRYAYRLSGSLQLAEDVVQEAFLELYRGLAEGACIENPRAWTLTVARRGIFRRVRNHRREGTRISMEELESTAAGRVQPDADRLLFGDVARLFSVLSPREEEVLLLRMEALKYSEIGARLGISANSVTTLLSRALKKLRSAVEMEKGEAPRLKEVHVSKALQ